ncbi:MAG: DUF4339 domain-containing protein [Verrucomicrobia bacterium]|nr:DUF5362 family protein [Kiritimatiellia bacterium]MCO6399783.1 DUF4339 domain-containing protein [Verrucomicrobiota bacterium]
MDSLWYYTVGRTEQRGPVEESEFFSLIRSGQIAPTELVWTQGMPAWIPLQNHPMLRSLIPNEATLTSAAPAPDSRQQEIALPTFDGWLAFIGIASIIGGALLVLTCVGIPIGVLMIFAGSAALSAKNALSDPHPTPEQLAVGHAKLRTFFILTGVVLILKLFSFAVLFLNLSDALVAAFAEMSNPF